MNRKYIGVWQEKEKKKKNKPKKASKILVFLGDFWSSAWLIQSEYREVIRHNMKELGRFD